MSLTLKPYPEYKESGLLWLGSIPAHWSVRRAKQIFSPIDIRSKDGNEELLTVSSKDSVLPRSQKKVTMFKAESYVGYKLCWPGDLVINSLWAWARGLGFSRYHGIVSSAYGVYRPKPQFASAFPYFDFLLRSDLYNWELHVRSKGIWVSRLQLTDESFFDMPIVVPPVDEAEKIAAYIRVKEQQIRKLIRAKRRVIELLNEQKQAIIQLAVTRGLDPNVRLKPSGIEWLGEIPLHWRCVRAKQVAYVFIPQRDKPELNESSGLHWITPVNIGSRFVEPSGLYISHEVVALNGLRAVPPNSVIATCVGRFGITSINNAPVIINQQLQAYTPKASILSEFLRYCVECSRPYFEQEGNSTTLAYVDRAGFGNLPIPLPPQSEQLQIVERIRIEESELLHAVLRVTNEINLLREYRTRLIADVVTGKFDVRGVELPKLDEVEEVSDVEDEELEDSEELVAVEENVDAN